jgi:hypothetical protein
VTVSFDFHFLISIVEVLLKVVRTLILLKAVIEREFVLVAEALLADVLSFVDIAATIKAIQLVAHA